MISFDGPFSFSQVANMDEVPLVFDLTPDHTLEHKGAAEVGIRVSSKYKVRATLVLCCMADGFRFPPFLIFKEPKGNLPKKLVDVYDPKKIVVKANTQGWVNKKMLQEWIKEVWLPNIKKDMSYLLVWDSFSCHKDQEILTSLLEEHDTQVEIIPGGCTSVLQPLDVGINKPFKDRIRNLFQSWVLARISKPSSELYFSLNIILF